jgi:hypothetical protein
MAVAEWYDGELIGQALADLFRDGLGTQLAAITTERDDGIPLPEPTAYYYSESGVPAKAAGPLLWVSGGRAVSGESVGQFRRIVQGTFLVSIWFRYEGEDRVRIPRLSDRYGHACYRTIVEHVQAVALDGEGLLGGLATFLDVAQIESGDQLAGSADGAAVLSVTAKTVSR